MEKEQQIREYLRRAEAPRTHKYTITKVYLSILCACMVKKTKKEKYFSPKDFSVFPFKVCVDARKR